jgi:hypothetical protein
VRHIPEIWAKRLYRLAWILSWPAYISAIGALIFLAKLRFTASVFSGSSEFAFYVTVVLIMGIALLGIGSVFPTLGSTICSLLLIVKSNYPAPRRRLAVFAAGLATTALAVAFWAIPRIIPAP